MLGDLTTELDFYADPYRTEADTWIDACGVDEKDRVYLVLSNTIFHPHGGGQKGDRGEVVVSQQAATALGTGTTISIIDTRKRPEGLAHILGVDLDSAAVESALVGTEKVQTKLDWDFRQRQMRLHSSAHLLHCFVEQVLGRTVSPPETSDLQADYGLNRYEAADLITQDQMATLLEQLNRFIAEGHQISTYADPTPGAREGARVWECEAWKIPCGGTHPANTSEIGLVEGDLSTKRGRTSMTFRVKP